jgi:hypothetical protein
MVIHIVIAVLVVVLLALLYAAYKVHFVLPYLAIRPSRMKVEDLVKRFGTPNVAELYGLQPERVSLPMDAHWIHGYFVPRMLWAQ